MVIVESTLMSSLVRGVGLSLRPGGGSACITPPVLSSPCPQETQELQKKQQWYQENQVTMTTEDEDLYLSYCSQAMFRIRILEQRLNR